MSLPRLSVWLANPRGYCAGVERAILIVERALAKFGRPVYVRHEIVHNRFVVEQLEIKGAVFVDELDQVPAGAPVIFSAHGVPKSVPAEAESRRLLAIDATCPLVSKVHREAELHHAAGRHILLIGHAGHPEVVGTMGQLPAGAITLIETEADAAAVDPGDSSRLAYITQTTLSIDETAAIIAGLRRRFPTIVGPRKEDICYATTNRQQAVQRLAPQCDYFMVIGAPNSSNSLRLVEAAKRAGCARATLVQRSRDIPWGDLADVESLGISAGASAPEVLVDEVVAALRRRFDVTVHAVVAAAESVTFKLPRLLDA
ncbi:MAG: 4-hydroxy-3-methylbut-2-enyl diphosphate reductase [Alphaproteobacteria bacterium]|nr:4-hydroxy-3-methylbut-2-enyl diphosphate reductase [Alphaproteobacteria bacterium]